uniref:MHD domain-containing protein n=1 Tax=Romanomermis culicivorax TaxID=13658 RepID=A0A915LEJ7_ROMCU
MGASGVYILDSKGNYIIGRNYRGDVSQTDVENFNRLLIDKEDDEGYTTPTFSSNSGEVDYVFVKKNNLYVVSISRKNRNVTMLLSFLHKLIEVFTEYFGQFDEEAIRDNFVMIYELLDETIDYGLPQITDSKILQEYVMQEGFSLQPRINVKPPAAVTNAVSWRSEGLIYRKNEVFIDVIESVNLLANANGQVVRCEIDGNIKMNVLLTGMPELRLGLNDSVLFERLDINETKNKGVELDDVKFHQCVRLSRFDNDRTISFIPPDGEFELMTYRMSSPIKPLIWVDAQIEKHAHSRIDYTIKATSNFKRRCIANNVSIIVPVPMDVDSPKFRTMNGSARYFPDTNAFVWTIKSFPGAKELLLSAHFRLPSIEGEDVEKKRPIKVSFEVPYYTVSGLQVRYLKVVEKDNYTALPWVRYLTKDGDYQLRIQ